MLAVKKEPYWNYELTGKSAHVASLSPLAEEVVVKPKKQLSLFKKDTPDHK